MTCGVMVRLVSHLDSVCHVVIITGNCLVTVMVGVVGLYSVPTQIISTTLFLPATALHGTSVVHAFAVHWGDSCNLFAVIHTYLIIFILKLQINIYIFKCWHLFRQNSYFRSYTPPFPQTQPAFQGLDVCNTAITTNNHNNMTG